MTKKIKLARLRPTKYIINYSSGTKTVRYEWAGCKPNSKPYTRDVPEEVFEWLTLNTSAISGGALVPVQAEVIDEIKEEMPEIIEELETNSHSHEEIVALLKGNINKMKSVLKGITSKQEKMFIAQVKKELVEGEGLNTNKVEFIDQWIKGNEE